MPQLGPAVRIEGAKEGFRLDYIAPLRATEYDLLVTFSAPCQMSPRRFDTTMRLFDAMAMTVSLVTTHG